MIAATAIAKWLVDQEVKTPFFLDRDKCSQNHAAYVIVEETKVSSFLPRKDFGREQGHQKMIVNQMNRLGFFGD